MESGQLIPIPTKLSQRSAFDDGLPRSGWVAVKVGYRPAAFVDGADVLTPALLPPSWEMFPALEPDLLLLRRYSGRSLEAGEHQRVAVVGPDKVIHRSMRLPWPYDPRAWRDGTVGETTAGVVTAHGIVGWNGEVTPLPVKATGEWSTEPRPISVLGGRTIVFQGPGYIESVDTVSGTRNRLPLPADQLKPARQMPWGMRAAPPPNYSYGVSYNSTATWMSSLSIGVGRLLAGANGELRWLPPIPGGVWFGDRLLLDGSDDPGHDQGNPVDYDPATDRYLQASVGPFDPKLDFSPRVDVTNRLEVDVAG